MRAQQDYYRADEFAERETDQNTHLSEYTDLLLRNRRTVAAR
jgi:hypothetical protein